MKENLSQILANSNKEIGNEKLMDYLNGRLSGPEQNEVEQWLSEQDDFGREALEGLKDFSSSQKLQAYTDTLNRELGHYLQQKKNRRQSSSFRDHYWTYLALILILLLTIAAYAVIRLLG